MGNAAGRLSASVSLVEAFTAATDRQPQTALGHARTVLDQAAALGISADVLRWAWPLAARAAHDLRDTAAVGELLALHPGLLGNDGAVSGLRRESKRS
jgi:hypothetical protein